MGIAGRAYARSMQNLLLFAETYVLALELYGKEADNEFRSKFAMYTPAMWTHCEMIGKHNLLPQFWLASDSFIAGVLRLENSMEKQCNLIGAFKAKDKNGNPTGEFKVETVTETGTIILKSLDQLSKLDESVILFAMSSATSPEEIRKFAYEYRKEWRKDNESKRPDYERKGDLLRVNHAIKAVNKNDWLAMGRLMGWTAA